MSIHLRLTGIFGRFLDFKRFSGSLTTEAVKSLLSRVLYFFFFFFFFFTGVKTWIIVARRKVFLFNFGEVSGPSKSLILWFLEMLHRHFGYRLILTRACIFFVRLEIRETPKCFVACFVDAFSLINFLIVRNSVRRNSFSIVSH